MKPLGFRVLEDFQGSHAGITEYNVPFIAAQKLKDKILTVAAELLGYEPSKLRIENGLVHYLEPWGRSITFQKAVNECYKRHVSLTKTTPPVQSPCLTPDRYANNYQSYHFVIHNYDATVPHAILDEIVIQVRLANSILKDKQLVQGLIVTVKSAYRCRVSYYR